MGHGAPAGLQDLEEERKKRQSQLTVPSFSGGSQGLRYP